VGVHGVPFSSYPHPLVWSIFSLPRKVHSLSSSPFPLVYSPSFPHPLSLSLPFFSPAHVRSVGGCLGFPPMAARFLAMAFFGFFFSVLFSSSNRLFHFLLIPVLFVRDFDFLFFPSVPFLPFVDPLVMGKCDEV